MFEAGSFANWFSLPMRRLHNASRGHACKSPTMIFTSGRQKVSQREIEREREREREKKEIVLHYFWRTPLFIRSIPQPSTFVDGPFPGSSVQFTIAVSTSRSEAREVHSSPKEVSLLGWKFLTMQ